MTIKDKSSSNAQGIAGDVSFCHLVVGVTDLDASLTFYRDILGMDVVFETFISGDTFDAVLHASRKQEGRVAGGLIGGLPIELLSLGSARSKDNERPKPKGVRGIQNISLSVLDLDETHRRIIAAGLTPEQAPFKIGDVRMFFVKDPDGIPVEFIELPNGARSVYEMYTGIPLQLGPSDDRDA
jgi:catechol 2,3-dioxygenase-like lactoylglutathione lyase family enzyme